MKVTWRIDDLEIPNGEEKSVYDVDAVIGLDCDDFYIDSMTFYNKDGAKVEPTPAMIVAAEDALGDDAHHIMCEFETTVAESYAEA